MIMNFSLGRKNGEAEYRKVEGKANTSDMLTKAVDRETITRHISTFGLEFRDGRNPMTPEFNRKDAEDPLGEVDG